MRHVGSRLVLVQPFVNFSGLCNLPRGPVDPRPERALGHRQQLGSVRSDERHAVGLVGSRVVSSSDGGEVDDGASARQHDRGHLQPHRPGVVALSDVALDHLPALLLLVERGDVHDRLLHTVPVVLFAHCLFLLRRDMQER